MNDNDEFGPISGPAMAEWCAMLRDDNAIHLSRDAAMAAGFGPRRVNPGPANLAYLISARMRQDPGGDIASVTAHFHGNVFEDDMLTAVLSRPEGPELQATLARGEETVLSAHFTLREDSTDD